MAYNAVNGFRFECGMSDGQAMNRYHVLAGVFLIASGGVTHGQTWLHPDLGGVSTRVGRVVISARNNGHITTSVPVGPYSFHNSNRGLTGLSYYGTYGRFDSISYRKVNRAAYTPYYLYRQVPRRQRFPMR